MDRPLRVRLEVAGGPSARKRAWEATVWVDPDGPHVAKLEIDDRGFIRALQQAHDVTLYLIGPPAVRS